MKRILQNTLLVLLALVCLSPAIAQENGWPRTVTLDEGTVTIYEPQVDEMSDDFIKFRAALAYREKPGDEPVFGAGWFESEVQVDQFSRTVHPVDLDVTQTRFPEEADVQTALSRAKDRPSFASNFTFSLDQLEASMKSTQAEAEAAAKLKTTPPEIIYRDNPALLVTIDGDPVLREVEDSSYEAVINTPYPMISDGKRYYLNVAEGAWYRADRATGPFRFIEQPPAGIAALVDKSKLDDVDTAQAASASVEKVTAANAPEIVVTTVPAELVVTEGPAAFVPLVDDLLVLSNSDDDVFLHVSGQQYYIVLAGRWYHSKSLNGPWDFQDSEQLPAAFAQIPQESDQADSRVYVAGTEEAQEAVLDAQVPQTAAVKRGEADVEVAYDGEPVFAPVDGTEMAYATNTGSKVILSDGLYYMVEDGVWYVSRNYDGPWQVSVVRPDQVSAILPSSPVYNTKYVYVYDYTPEVVYVGYTPGYLGSDVYHNTVLYGSGGYYRPWVSPRWYYPHHSTWGFHVNYDPWYGWNFGLSWGWGPFNFSYWSGGYWHHNHYWHYPRYGYWGPHGYRPRHHHHRPPGHRPPGHRPPGHGGGNRPHPYERHHNLYADERQRAPVAGTRDNPPRDFNNRRGDGEFVGKAYAKNGGATGNGKKRKSAAFKPQPVSRADLAVKAQASDASYRAGKKKVVSSSSGKAYSKAYLAQKSSQPAMKSPARKLTRNDLALKAKTSDSKYKSSQKKAAPAGGSKAVSRSARIPDYKLSRKDLAKVKAPVSRSKTQPVSRSTGYSKARSAPKVRLTSPQKKSSYAYSKPRASTPSVNRVQKSAPPKQYSQAKAPKQSRSSSPAKQQYKAPSRSSKPAVQSKQKQHRTK